MRHLGSGTAEEVAPRRDRLAAALADFDAATVATVHEFCQQVLTSLGVAADTDPHVQLVESLDDVVDDVVADLYLRHVTSVPEGEPALTLGLARQLAEVATSDRQAVLLPDLAEVEPGTEAALRRRYADAVRAEVSRRTRAARVVGFDDLLVRVRDALADPVLGPVAQERLRSRFEVVLVDEFQDTDPVQWEVLRLAFHGHRPLVLIGDPKQAIYAFRGADVHAYLAAAAAADQRRTLDRNFRSDPAVLAGPPAGLPRGGPGRRRDRGAGGRGGPRHGRRAAGAGRARCGCGSSAARATRRTRAACSPRRWPARWWRPTSRPRWCAPCRPASPTPRAAASRVRSRRATSPCWCPPGSPPSSCATPCAPSGWRACSPAPPASSARRRRPTGSRCCRASTSRTGRRWRGAPRSRC